MKPDDFSDQIRRKLESVEPEFREKDWTRMQQALGHSTPVFAFGAKTTLLAAASIVAVMAFGGVAYKQYQANQQLQQQVWRLNQTVKSLRQSAILTPEDMALKSVPPDTVYLTRDVVRYVAVPVDRKRTDGIPQTNSLVNSDATETPSTVSNRPATGASPLAPNQLSASPTGLPGPLGSRQTGVENQKGGVDTPAGSLVNGSEIARSDGSNRNVTNGADNHGVTGQNGKVSLEATQTNGAEPASGNTAMNSNNSVHLPLLSSRPLVRDTVYYQEGMARNARRIRRWLSTNSPSGIALAKVDVNRSEPVWDARFGPGANLGVKQWGIGLFGEMRLNTHWRLGLGVGSMNLRGENFLTEIAYGQRTKQDFRRTFAPQIDPRHDIINIIPKGSSWQVPIRVSYRFGLGSGWALVPSAGVNLSISNREEIGFAYFRGPGKIELVTLLRRLPQKKLHAGSAAIYLEKNWGDWALQLGPYGAVPLDNTPSRLTINIKTVGASARLFYQINWQKQR